LFLFVIIDIRNDRLGGQREGKPEAQLLQLTQKHI